MHTKKKSPKLREIIPQIEEELRNVRSRTPRASRRTHKRATLNLVMLNYGEVLQILKRIQAQQKKYRRLEERYPVQQVRDLTDRKVEEAWSEQAEIRSSVRLDIKTLYIWAHQIKDIFLQHKVRIDLSELSRIAFLRNYFITHVSKTPFFQDPSSTQPGLLFDREFEKIEIVFHSLSPTRVKQRKFSGLIKDMSVHIPELQIEKNFFERIKIVYRNLNKLRGTGLKKDAQELLSKFGLRTEPPGEIAEALLVALKEYRRLKRL
jgi:hypothetical protein